MNFIRKSLSTAIVAISLFHPLTTLADDDQVTQDVRCVVASLAVQANADAATRAKGAAGMLFFLGRLDGKLSEVALDDRVAIEAIKMKIDGGQADFPRCGAQIIEKGHLVTRLGEYLEQRGNAMKRNEQ